MQMLLLYRKIKNILSPKAKQLIRDRVKGKLPNAETPNEWEI